MQRSLVAVGKSYMKTVFVLKQSLHQSIMPGAEARIFLQNYVNTMAVDALVHHIARPMIKKCNIDFIFRQRLVTCQAQAITCTNADIFSFDPSGISVTRAFSVLRNDSKM